MLENYILIWWLIYLIITLFLKKNFKITFYFNLIILILLSLIILFIYLNINEIAWHAANWAPLLMLIFAIYFSAIIISLLIFITELIIYLKNTKTLK